MAGDLLPHPRLLSVLLVDQVLGEQPGEIVGTVVIAPREVVVFRSRFLDAHAVHDGLLPGVNAEGVEPALADVLPFDHDVRLLRRGGVGYAVAASALDGEHLAIDALAAGLIHVLRVVTAAVHEGDADFQLHAVCELIGMVDHLVELLPDLGGVRASHDNALLDAPLLAEMPVAHDLVFEAVILGIDAAGQHQNAVRQLGGVFLAPPHHGLLVLQVAAVLPELAELRVVHDLQLLCAAERVQIGEDQRRPRRPGRGKGVQPERPNAVLVCVWIGRDPLGGLMLHFPLGVQRLAGRAFPVYALHGVVLLVLDDRGVVLEADVAEDDVVILSAGGTFMVPAFLCALAEKIVDLAVAFDGRRRDGDAHLVVEGGLPGLGQLPRIALCAGTDRPAVQLVADDIPDRHRGQRGGTVGAAHRQHAAGVALLENGVAALPALRVCDLAFQHLAIPHHRSDAELGELLRVLDRRMDVQDRARILIDDVADGVQLELALADLGAGDHDDQLQLRVGKGIHRLFQVRGAGCAPRSRLCAALRRQASFSVCPLRYGNIFRSHKAGDGRGDRSVELFFIAAILPHPLHRSTSAAPSRACGTRRDHT